jgi:diacylglycerol kinase family enzyme
LEPRKIVVLLNASAGALEGPAGTALADALASAFKRHELSADLQLLPSKELRGGAQRALQKITDRQFDAVVVGGGDGSIATVASVLAGSGVPLGIIPLGTLNHFGKDLGIPLTWEAAVATIAAGHVRDVDVGEVNGEIFINNSSIGIYPYLVLGRERIRRREGRTKWAAMLLAALRTLRFFPLRRLRIRAAGEVEPVRSPCVFVGNNEYRLIAPAMGTRERLDGGELCVYVAKQQSRLALFWVALRSVLGLLDPPRELRILKVPAAEIVARRHRLLVACDGEVRIIRSPLRYRSRPGALRVLVPSAAQAATARFTSTIPG